MGKLHGEKEAAAKKYKTEQNGLSSFLNMKRGLKPHCSTPSYSRNELEFGEGFRIRYNPPGDGNCQFNAICDQLNQNQFKLKDNNESVETHTLVRKEIVE